MQMNITCRRWQENDLPHLLSYLLNLSTETKQRFGPHEFTLEALQTYYHHRSYTGFLLIENNSTYIIGYAILKQGFLEHDFERISSYQINPNSYTDATYAPCLADDWQSKGLGQLLWENVKEFLIHNHINRVILWGGVQQSNSAALGYYKKLGFRELGIFGNAGIGNWDMICEIE